MKHESWLVFQDGERLGGHIWEFSREKEQVKFRTPDRERMITVEFHRIEELYTPHRDNGNFDDFVWVQNGEHIMSHREDLT